MTNTYAPYRHRTAFDVMWISPDNLPVDDDILRQQGTDGDLLSQALLDGAAALDNLDEKITRLCDTLRGRLDSIANSISRSYAHPTVSNAEDGGALDALLADRQRAIGALRTLVGIYNQRENDHG